MAHNGVNLQTVRCPLCRMTGAECAALAPEEFIEASPSLGEEPCDETDEDEPCDENEESDDDRDVAAPGDEPSDDEDSPLVDGPPAKTPGGPPAKANGKAKSTAAAGPPSKAKGKAKAKADIGGGMLGVAGPPAKASKAKGKAKSKAEAGPPTKAKGASAGSADVGPPTKAKSKGKAMSKAAGLGSGPPSKAAGVAVSKPSAMPKSKGKAKSTAAELGSGPPAKAANGASGPPAQAAELASGPPTKATGAIAEMGEPKASADLQLAVLAAEAQAKATPQGDGDSALGQQDMLCDTCGRLTAFCRLRLLSKKQCKWQCLSCGGKAVALRRKFGSWPLDSFASLTKEQRSNA
jgi:hypothetical protein